jgi:hypothetical protein
VCAHTRAQECGEIRNELSTLRGELTLMQRARDADALQLTSLQDQLAVETTMKNLFKTDAAEKDLELAQLSGTVDVDRTNKDKLIAHWREQVDAEQQARRLAEQDRVALARDKLNLEHGLKKLVRYVNLYY